jgi:hypothetical protein
MLFVHTMTPCVCLAVSPELPDGQDYLLPWEIVAEKIRGNGRFCVNNDLCDRRKPQNSGEPIDGVDPNCGYAYQPNQAVTIELPQIPVTGDPLERIDVNLARWASGSWDEIGRIGAIREPNDINVPGGIEEEGLFRLSFTFDVQEGDPCHLEAFAVVCGNWKKDILSFCRKLKEEIELNPDAELIRHSMAVSHFDHTMEMVSEAPYLSGRILNALTDAITNKKAFDDGQYPDFVGGLNKIRLRRFDGAGIAEFGITVPADHDSSRVWPLLVTVDVQNWVATNRYVSNPGLIHIWWHTTSKNRLRWKDYEALIGLIEQKLNIDKDRVYIEGQCANGIEAMALALNYTDHWAECSASMGNSYRKLAGNAFNLPMIFVKGRHNQESFVGYYDFAVKCFQYHRCRNFKHSNTQSVESVRGARIPQAVRERNPLRVLFTIESCRNPRAYWVEVGGREDENLPGTIDVCVWGQTVLVRTENIDAYSLDLLEAPIDVNRPIEIIENRRNLGFPQERIFVRKSEKYIDAELVKNEHLHGPVWDVFREPYVVVYGTGGEDKSFCTASKSAGDSLSFGGPCFADVNMPEELIGSHNLILVGSAGSNLWLSKIQKDLPVQVEPSGIVIGQRRYEGLDMGLILIYPNPLNREKYVVVFSGTSANTMVGISDAYSQMKSLRAADVGVFEVTESGQPKWHIIEKFNTVWGWHDKWDKVLAVAERQHPEWQWRQWVAKAIRKQLETDAVVCEPPFMFEDSKLGGEITYRSLFNNIRNDWILKIRLNGNNLRKLLMVPFSDISKRKVDAPIIDGVVVVRNPLNKGANAIAINELVDSAVYTVALPEKCINGQRIGLVLQDYQIVDQAHLTPILRDYLAKNEDGDIDSQLDNLKFSVF